MLKSTASETRLAGAAIGNGWIDPTTQYPAYIDFAVTKGLLKPNTKVT